MWTVLAQGGLIPDPTMPPISHKECGVLLTSSCQHEPVVVNPASGEAKPVKVGSQLLFDEAGWAFLTCPGEEARWVKSILEVSVQKTKDGQVYFHNRATSSTTWQATLSKSSSRRYPVALLDGREWPLSVLRMDLPRDGQLCFWDLRLFQEHIFSLNRKFRPNSNPSPASPYGILQPPIYGTHSVL